MPQGLKVLRQQEKLMKTSNIIETLQSFVILAAGKLEIAEPRPFSDIMSRGNQLKPDLHKNMLDAT